MMTIEKNNDLECQIIKYILKTSKDKSVEHILARLNAFKKMFLGIENV